MPRPDNPNGPNNPSSSGLNAGILGVQVELKFKHSNGNWIKPCNPPAPPMWGDLEKRLLGAVIPVLEDLLEGFVDLPPGGGNQPSVPPKPCYCYIVCDKDGCCKLVCTGDMRPPSGYGNGA